MRNSHYSRGSQERQCELPNSSMKISLKFTCITTGPQITSFYYNINEMLKELLFISITCGKTGFVIQLTLKHRFELCGYTYTVFSNSQPSYLWLQTPGFNQLWIKNSIFNHSREFLEVEAVWVHCSMPFYLLIWERERHRFVVPLNLCIYWLNLVWALPGDQTHNLGSALTN